MFLSPRQKECSHYQVHNQEKILSNNIRKSHRVSAHISTYSLSLAAILLFVLLGLDNQIFDFAAGNPAERT